MQGTKPHLAKEERNGFCFDLSKWEPYLRFVKMGKHLRGLPGVEELTKLAVWDKAVVCFVRQAGAVG